MRHFIFAVLFILSNSCLWAAVKLPALVGDNMVLQRDAKINLWGWADPGEKVTIQFQSKQFNTKAGKDGKWMIVLPPFPAGGPYNMVIKGKNNITLQNILIGDVWLASGQSNMEWPLNNINNSKQEIETANYPQIRLFTVAKNFAFQPKAQLGSGNWTVCSPKAVDSFSAVAYLFGRELHQRYKVPVGLIHSSWGGTPAEAWTSAEGLKPIQSFEKALDEVSKMDVATYEAYKAKKDAWLREFGGTDRGRLPNKAQWTDITLDTSDWLKMKQPGIWSANKELKGYSGTIWFRKEIDVSTEAAGKPITLSLGVILLSDSAFFNGQFIGNAVGYDKKRLYEVPGNLVKSGRNLIVLRIVGFLNYGGMVSLPDEIYAQTGEQKIPLTGEWLYKTAPDISNLPEVLKSSGLDPNMPQTPSILFNAMIAPLIPYTVKGAIWYQGESNADNMEEAMQYSLLFPAMIKDWRQRWGYDFPFLFVQLAGYQPNEPEPGDYSWAHVREAQFKTLSMPNTGMATAIDIGEEKNIHPKNKQDVAHRLALTAQKVAYRENVVYSGPTFKSMTVEGNKIRLTFDNIGTGLWIKDNNDVIRSFAIAGEDKKFVWAKAYQDGNDVRVYSESIKHPIAVRYNWCNTPDGSLYNKENLPAVPFRTDNW
ncbi:MAG: 9-O-acetylesterase [Segetibacter sp.]|nr:9-O-acetylesterase [Segetibacter sp.]